MRTTHRRSDAVIANDCSNAVGKQPSTGGSAKNDQTQIAFVSATSSGNSYDNDRRSYPELLLGLPEALSSQAALDDLRVAVSIASQVGLAIHPDAKVRDVRATLQSAWTGTLVRIHQDFPPKDAAYRDYFRLARVGPPLTSLVVGITGQLLTVLEDIEANDCSISTLDVFGLITGSLGVLQAVMGLMEHP